MAVIGVKHLVFAPISAMSTGSRPTYGTGQILAKLTKVDYEPNVVDGTFYADDVLCEEEHYVSGGSLKIGVADFALDAHKSVFGNKTSTVSTVKELYKGSDDTAPYVGVGYIVPKKVNGSKVYEARFLLKVMFKEPSASAETKGESIAFQGMEIEGSFSPVEGYEGDRYIEIAEFPTETAAIEWLNTKAHVSGASLAAAASAPATTSNK